MILLLFSFAVLYPFGPNLKDRRWQGAFPARWPTLLTWLYLTGEAIFIGGKANSEIEKAAAKAVRTNSVVHLLE